MLGSRSQRNMCGTPSLFTSDAHSVDGKARGAGERSSSMYARTFLMVCRSTLSAFGYLHLLHTCNCQQFSLTNHVHLVILIYFSHVIVVVVIVVIVIVILIVIVVIVILIVIVIVVL